MRRWTMVAVLLSWVLPHSAQGQYRALDWPAVAVEAHLDSTGTLHVRERQEMRFTGDWNGGQRQFDVRLGQRFTFRRLARIDAAGGGEVALREGPLDAVDEYAWAEGHTLRWRSRLPNDPPFLATTIPYVLEFSYSRILVPQTDSFLLDHDFAFADREGDIEAFTLRLTMHPVWAHAADFAGTFGPVRLPPGEGFVVTLPLAYRGPGRPAGVEFGAEAPTRHALVAASMVALLVLLIRLVRRERALGRFVPPPPQREIDERWLADHVFFMLPEAVGAAWDNHTAAPEVTAVLARMVAERKLASEVKTAGWKVFRRHVLHLRLLVDRKTLASHERSLVDALFSGSSTTTDTDSVRARYAKTGFDPASRIRETLDRLVTGAIGRRDTGTVPSKRPTLVLTGVAVALLIAGAVGSVRHLVIALAGAGVTLLFYIFAAPLAIAWRSRVDRLGVSALGFLVPIVLFVASFAVVAGGGFVRAGVLTWSGLALLQLAAINSVLNLAASREGVRRIAVRKRLAAARRWFQRELRRPDPQLRDEWFPYLIAFGLGAHMDRWFRSFGGTSSHTTRMASSGSAMASHHAGGGSSWTGMGGGGGFAGGGSSGMWVAAAGGMAAGVAKPSSSSSGGSGGGGGGSSGGGGGGGW